MARPCRLWKHLASVVVVGVALCLPAASASASTAQLIELEVTGGCKYVPPGSVCSPAHQAVLAYEAGAGERNRVRIAADAEGVRVTDPGATVKPGPGCTRIDIRSVRCAPESGIFVSTGGGDDRVRIELDFPTIADGGAGTDVIVGGPGHDRLYGGKGADILRGAKGSDELYDGSLRSPLRDGDLDPFTESTFLPVAGAGRGRDSFDGGGGRDTLGYQGRRGDISVDLASGAAAAGARGERDLVKDVESAVGGNGNDRLAGTRRGNWLDGGGGDDRIRAGRGDDSIDGGSGRNVYFAGPGDDLVNSQLEESNVGTDRMFCGPGADRVMYIFSTDFVNDDCESLELGLVLRVIPGTVASFLPLDSEGSRVVLEVSDVWCTYVVGAPPCALDLAILVDGPGTRGGTAPPRGAMLGSASYMFMPNERKSVTLSLSDAGAAMLRDHGVLRVRIHITEGEPEPSSGYLTVLRAPR
jgi:hypothetical protein